MFLSIQLMLHVVMLLSRAFYEAGCSWRATVIEQRPVHLLLILLRLRRWHRPVPCRCCTAASLHQHHYHHHQYTQAVNHFLLHFSLNIFSSSACQLSPCIYTFNIFPTARSSLHVPFIASFTPALHPRFVSQPSSLLLVSFSFTCYESFLAPIFCIVNISIFQLRFLTLFLTSS